jgi:hypothetical protein
MQWEFNAKTQRSRGAKEKSKVSSSKANHPLVTRKKSSSEATAATCRPMLLAWPSGFLSVPKLALLKSGATQGQPIVWGRSRPSKESDPKLWVDLFSNPFSERGRRVEKKVEPILSRRPARERVDGRCSNVFEMILKRRGRFIRGILS